MSDKVVIAEPTLKPCPFCGHSIHAGLNLSTTDIGDEIGRVDIDCNFCHLNMCEGGFIKDAKIRLITKWNTRKGDTL